MTLMDMWAGSWSDMWGTEVPDQSQMRDFYNTLVEIYVDTSFGTLVDIIHARYEPTCLSELKGNGAGSFKVSKSDSKILKNPTLIEFRNYVKIRLNGLVIGGFIIQNKRTVIVGAGEESDEMWELSGEGPKSWAKDASVYPSKGLKNTSAETRYFNFSTERGSWYVDADWVYASRRWKYNAPKAPKGTAPAEWPDAPNAQWIWNSSYDGNDPLGFCYFRLEFTVTGTAGETVNHAFFIAADDSAEVFVDGEQKAIIEQPGWHETTRVELELEPGAHVIGVKAFNYKSNGPGEILTALYKYGDPSVPSSAVLLNHSGMANTWRVNGYPAVEPGWTVGDLLLTLLNEAKARGVRFANNFTPTFSSTLDSAGKPWNTSAAWSFGIGSSTYEDVFQAVEELGCDIYVHPDTLQMHVWNKRGFDRSIDGLGATKEGNAIIFSPGHNLLAGEENGQAELANTLMLRTPEGWVEKTPTDATSKNKYGRIETQMSTQLTATGAQGLVDAFFAQKALPEVSATFTIVPVKGMIPFIDFNVGDWVSAPGDLPGVRESRRVMSISFTEDSNTGLPVYALEFDTIFKDRQTELERWVSRLANSAAIGGGFTNSSDLPSTVVVSPPGNSSGPIPDQPTGLVVSSLGRWTDDGRSVSDFGLTWNPVVTGFGFGSLSVDHYEVWGRLSTETELQRISIVYDTMAYLTNFTPGDTWVFAVRAVSNAGPGEFSDLVSLKAEAPLIALGKPSTPTYKTDFGVVEIKWDGLLGGNPAPVFVKYIKVERKLTAGSTWAPIGALVRYTLQDIPGSPGQSFDYRLVAVDIYGRDSVASDPVTVVVQGVDLGNLEQDVQDAIQAAQDAADAAAAVAGTASSAAQQAQIDADNAQTVSNQAQQTATQAISNASAALTAANNAQSSADGMISWSPNAPVAADGTGKPVDAVWYRTSANGVIGQWRWTGSAWTSTPIDNDAIFSINAVKITAGTLDAARIGANTIGANKLLIGNFDNQIPDPGFTNVSVSGWNATAHQLMVGGGRSAATNAIRITGTGAQRGAYNPTNIPVREGDIYRISVWVKSSISLPAASNLLAPYFQVDRLGTTMTTGGLNNATAIPADTWTKLEMVWTVPAGGYQVRSGLFAQPPLTAGATLDFTEPEMIRVSDSTLIQDGAISTTKLTAGAVTADKIMGSTITGDKISAGTISANKMLITNLTNIAEDPSFEYSSTSGVAWTFAGGASVGTVAPRTGTKSLAVPTAASAYQAASSVNAFSVEESDQYRLSAWVRLGSGTVSNVGVTLRIRYGATEATTNTTTADIVLTPETTDTAYVRMSDIWTVPAGAKYARLDIVQRDTTVGKTYYIDDVSIYKLSDAELIVDGSIIATKIGADAVTAEKIQAGAVATEHLQAESITTEKIASEAITAEQIAASTISADLIAAGAIQVSHLSPSVGDSLDISANSSVNILIENKTSAMSGDLTAVKSDVKDLTTYYSFGADAAIIGKSDSSFKLYLMNDKIEIRENGIPVSWWDSGRMVVQSFEGVEVILGNHKLEKYGTGTVVRRV